MTAGQSSADPITPNTEALPLVSTPIFRPKSSTLPPAGRGPGGPAGGVHAGHEGFAEPAPVRGGDGSRRRQKGGQHRVLGHGSFPAGTTDRSMVLSHSRPSRWVEKTRA